MTPILSIAAVLLAIFIEGRYMYSIVKGRTKPSFVAFLIFTIEMAVVCFASYSLGARDAVWLLGTFTVLHFLTTLLALKYGYLGFSKFNVVCLTASILGIAVWWYTSNPWYALLLETAIDSIGYLVLSRKVSICSGTEDALCWGLSIVAYGLNLVLITHWVPQEYLFSLANVFWCSVILFLSLRK